MIELYTDGAARGNPGPGGYGIVLISRKHKLRKELNGGFRRTTNNRMELLAVILGLEALKQEGLEVVVYSDSKYVVDAINQGWIWNWVKKGFKNKKNVDLWKRFIPAYRKHKVRFVWVKGHAGYALNERCDQLATEAADKPNLPPDVAFEQEDDTLFEK